MKMMVLAEKSSVSEALSSYFYRHGMGGKYECYSASGHLIRMAEPDEYGGPWSGRWSFDALPMLPEKFLYALPDDEKLRDKAESACRAMKLGGWDAIVNACDPDREGEAIFWRLYDFSGSDAKVLRLWCNDMTDASIAKALGGMREYGDGGKPNLDGLKAAAESRAEMDWKIGMNLTRAATLALGDTVKLGRVKTPTLWILADLEKRIAGFEPHSSYRIALGYAGAAFRHVREDGKGGYENASFESESRAEELASALNGKKGCKVVSACEKKTRRRPPRLYSLGALQVDASKRLGMSVKETNEAAQSLYEKKILTYPRTKCEYLSTEAASRLREMVGACRIDPELSAVPLDERKISAEAAGKRYVDDSKTAEEGHCAITPTGEPFAWDALGTNERKIFRLVAKRLLAIFLPDGIDSAQTILASSHGELFRAASTIVLEPGWRKLYGAPESGKPLPSLKPGGSFAHEGAEVLKAEAAPPKRMTDGDLIAAMKSPARYLRENNEKYKAVLKETDGMGTEATRGEIVQQLLSDGYVEMATGHVLRPTEKGMKIFERIGGMEICSVDLTARWETMLEEIAGGADAARLAAESDAFVARAVAEFRNGRFESISEKRRSLGKCPACGGNVYEGKYSYYCENYRSGGGCGFAIKKEVGGARIAEKDVKQIMSGEATRPIKMTFGQGNAKKTAEKRFVFDPGSGRIAFYKAPYAEFPHACPYCGGKMRVGEKGIYCENYRSDAKEKHAALPKEFCGHAFSDGELARLLEGAAVGPLELKSRKTGRTFAAGIAYDLEANKLSLSFDDGGKAIGECPRCGGSVVGPLQGKYGEYYACSNRCGLSISAVQGGRELDAGDVAALLEMKEIGPFAMRSKKGVPYEAKLRIDAASGKVEKVFNG